METELPSAHHRKSGPISSGGQTGIGKHLKQKGSLPVIPAT
jgi:hypothetical protein